MSTLEGHQDIIRSFVFLQDDVHIVSGSDDGTMRKWDCETGQLVGEPWEGNCRVLALALSPDGKTIACGRNDGSVQRWDTNGQMKEDIWTGHHGAVGSLSWSPSGGHLASGSRDGTILVRNVESGAIEVGPIENNWDKVRSVAYSPLGDRIASGGCDIICIWDSHTGELLVGPITDRDLEDGVTCVVWSSDSSKLYSASDQFARVFDSTSGTLLHRFEHDDLLYSIALSPKDNLLACVGSGGTAQLWDTESHQPFDDPFANKATSDDLRHVAFSLDGRYLAYGGYDKKIMLWTVGDEPAVPASSTNLQGGTQQDILPKSQSSFSLNVGDTNLFAQSAVNDEQGPNDPYNGFFAPSHSSLPLPSPNPSPRRRFRRVLSVLHLPTNGSMRHKHFTRRIFQRRAPSHPPANCEQPQPTLEGMSGAVNEDEERGNVNSSKNVAPGTTEHGNDKGKQRRDPVAHRKFSTLSSPAELDTNDNRALWKSLFRSRKHDSNNSPAKVTRGSSNEVVDVYAVRIRQGYVAHKRKDKKKSAPKGESSQADPMKHVNPAHPPTSSQGPSSQPIAGHAGQPLQVNNAGYSDNDSYSDTSTHGPLLRFIDKICFPCGHYEHEDT